VSRLPPVSFYRLPPVSFYRLPRCLFTGTGRVCPGSPVSFYRYRYSSER
jgi:hypothetical protein